MSTFSCGPKFDYVNNKTHINKWKTTTNSVQSKCLFFYGSRLAFASDKRDFAIGVMPSGEPLRRV